MVVYTFIEWLCIQRAQFTWLIRFDSIRFIVKLTILYLLLWWNHHQCNHVQNHKNSLRSVCEMKADEEKVQLGIEINHHYEKKKKMLCSDVRSCSCVHCMCMSMFKSHNKAKMKTQIAEKERGREQAKTLLDFTKLFIDNNLYNMGGIEQCWVTTTTTKTHAERRVTSNRNYLTYVIANIFSSNQIASFTPSVFPFPSTSENAYCIFTFVSLSSFEREIKFNNKIVKQIAFVNCMRWNLCRWIKSSKRKWMKMFAMWKCEVRFRREKKSERADNFASICGFMCATS